VKGAVAMSSDVPAEPASAGVRSMAGAQRIGRNFTFRMVAQVVSAVINVGAMVLLGNYLDADGYGRFVFWYALIPLVGSLADLGAGVMVTKRIARERLLGPRHLGDALILKGIVTAFVLTVGATVAWTMFPRAEAMLLTLVCVLAVVDFGQDVAVWVTRGHERLDLEAVLLLVSQVAWIAGIAIGIAMHASLATLFLLKIAAFVLRLAVGAWLVRRSFYTPRFEFDLGRLRQLLAEAVPFGFAMCFVVLYGRVGVLMLQGLATSTDVALFNVGYMLSQPLGFLSTALSMAAFPALARRAQRGDAAIREALLRTTKYQLVVTLPLMVGLYLLAGRVIPLLFHGDGFERAGFALQLMSLGLGFIFVNLMSRYVLAALDRQRHYLIAVLAGLVTNVGLGFALIPRFGFAGACVALLAGEAAILIACQMVLTRWVPIRDLARAALRPAIAAAVMGGVIVALGKLPWPVIVVVAAGVYLALVFALRTFDEEERRLLRGMASSFMPPPRRAEGRSA